MEALLLQKIAVAVTVLTVAVVVGNAVTSPIAGVLLGGAAGAAAGVTVLQTRWEEEARTGRLSVAVTAAAGGLAGAAAVILQSIIGAQSLTGSAVVGAMAGAAVVAVEKERLEQIIKKIQRMKITAIARSAGLGAAPSIAAATSLAAASISSKQRPSGSGVSRPASSCPRSSEPSISDPSGQKASDPYRPQVSDPPGPRASDPPKRRASDPPGARASNPPEPRSSDPPELRASGPSGPISSDPPEPRESDPPEPRASDPPKPRASDPSGPISSDPPEQKASDPPETRASDPSGSRSSDSPERRVSDPPEQRASYPPKQRASDPPGPRASDAPGPRSSDSPEPRSSDPPGPRASGPSGPRASDPSGPRASDPPGARASNLPEPRASDPPEPRVSDPPGPRASDPPGPRASDPPEPRASDPSGPRASDPPGPRASDSSGPRSSDSPEPRASDPREQRASDPPERKASDPPGPRASDPPGPRASDPSGPRSSDSPEPRSSDSPEPRASDLPEPRASDLPEPRASDPPEPRSSDSPEPRPSDPPEPRASDPRERRASDAPERKESDPPGPRASDPPKQRASDPPGARASNSPEPRSSDPPGSRASDPPEPRASDPPGPRASDPPKQRASDPPGARASNSPEPRSSDPPGSRATGPSRPRASDPPELLRATGINGAQSHSGVKEEINDDGTAHVSPEHFKQDVTETEKIQNLLNRLIGKNTNIEITVFQLTEQSLQSYESEEELVLIFIQRLLMMNYRARDIYDNYTNVPDHTPHRDYDSSEDVFTAMTLSTKRTSECERIHPMDVQMAVFHCADGFLKQLMVTKLSQCQYALPLLVPDPFTTQIEFPLWTFRLINKSWKIRNTNDETFSQTQPIYKAQTPMVSFFRFGSVSSSKSQLMNSLINERHNTFFHRNCPGSSRTRVLMDGVVEIAWFCPSGKNKDNFSDCVAFCNLHGDAGEHENQLQILTEMASVNVVLLPRLGRNDRHAEQIQNLFKNKKPLICLFTEDESAVIEMKKGKFKIGLKDRNQSDVCEELRRTINQCLSESMSTFRLEDISKHPNIRTDEDNDNDCRRGREAAQQMISLLEKKDLTEIKESLLPHQGKLWHQWSQKNKELHRPQGDEIEQEISNNRTEMSRIRQQQHDSDISDFMKLFIKNMSSDSANKVFFIKWLRILLDEYSLDDISDLHYKYDKEWSAILKLKENHDKKQEFEVQQTELEKISEDLQAATFGVEHIMREIAQIYESCSSVQKNKKDLPVQFSSLPGLAAEMMISGFPLELMDGDAAHVPLVWISAVLDELNHKLGDQRVFVLSVLGIQSSGKSTMLNAMFGLQFAVSAGRCTRGAFMQLVRVSDQMRRCMKFDYILVVDTEGLRALELAGRSTRNHDNELATFVVGLGNLTLINIFGENPSEMQDILQIVVQAFMRMNQVRLNPSCVFVHQNVSDVTAGEKNMEGRRRLQKTLDEMTKLAAKEEVCDAECFSDVIEFDVQNDVKYFAQLWEGSPPMAPPNLDYCENIQDLKEYILSYASKSHVMMLKDLKVHIKDLWEALLNERFVFSFRNSLEISAYKKLETKYSEWSWSLRSAMMDIENKLHNQIENEAINEVEECRLQEELKKTSEGVNNSMSEFFEKEKDKNILIHWKSPFGTKIKNLQENILRETKRKLNEVLQQRDMKKKIDAQRTQHENTLFEKSKELALKLKDKANDEETLKKEFDVFWKECGKKIIRDTPAIRDIDVMRDVRQMLRDTYESVSVDKWRDIVPVSKYSDYVQVKKSSRSGKNVTSVMKKFGHVLSKEDAAQIRSLVTNVLHQTEKEIQSFNISKMGYNKSCIQQLMDYIKARVTEHEEQPLKYVFKNEFFMDLVLSIFVRMRNMITDQHKRFREDNDPEIYVEKKRDEYYSIFQKYCHGATSAAIFGEIICQKLKEPIEQSVYRKTARDLAEEMRTNCPSLNGNRSNLEKHILRTLAEEEDFNKYMNYIKTPRDHFKGFIRDEVSVYITERFNDSVLPKMKLNIKLLHQKIMEAAHESTEDVQVNSGDVDLWLRRFTQQISDQLIFSVKDLSGVKHDDVDDFNLLEKVIRQELPAIVSDISSRFSSETFPDKLDVKFRPDELLIDHLCQCCWAQCPFCGAICTNTIENHDEDHSVPFHRVDGINGWHYHQTNKLCSNVCTTLVTCSKRFCVSNEQFPYKEYRRAGGDYEKWSITPDLSDLPYWKWFVCRFQKDLEKQHGKTFGGNGKIPEEWRRFKKQDAIESLNTYV